MNIESSNVQKSISFAQYLAIFISSFIGLYIGSILLPKYDDILYPFAPNFSFLVQFYKILFPLGFFSMFTALITSWVYKKTISSAAFGAFLAITTDYKFNLFTNLSEHYFHVSYILVYAFGVFVSYWIIRVILGYFGTAKT